MAIHSRLESLLGFLIQPFLFFAAGLHFNQRHRPALLCSVGLMTDACDRRLSGGEKYSYGYGRYSPAFDVGLTTSGRLLSSLPKRGDVIVFRLPRDPKVNLIKRVIGLPNDRIRMKDGRLYINRKIVPISPDGDGGVELGDGREMQAARYAERFPAGSPSDVQISLERRSGQHAGIHGPAGTHLRDGRQPGRFARQPCRDARRRVGFVPVENLVGQACVVVGSYDFLNMGWPAKWLAALRSDRSFTVIR